MSSEKKNISNSLRYLKARLEPFKRPEFLLSLTVLSVFSVFIWQFLQDPQWIEKLSGVPESAVDSSNPESVANDYTLSGELPEEGLQLIGTGTPSLISSPTPKDDESKEKETEGKKSQDKAESQEPQNSTKQSFKEALEALTDPNAFGSLLPTIKSSEDSNNSSATNSSLFNVPQFNFNDSNTKQTNQQVSALQQAIQQLELNKANGQQRETNNSENALGNEGSSSSLRRGANNDYEEQYRTQQIILNNQRQGAITYQAPSNIYNNSSQPNYYNYSGQSQPINLAPAPVNLTPTVPNNNSTYNYGTRQAAPPVFSQPQTVNTPTFNNNQFNQGFQANPRTITPRQVPGRYIGGGEINTFSNP